MCSYYRKFLRGYAEIAAPLHAKLKKSETKLEWTDDCEHSFNRLKEALTTSPILTFPQMDRQFIVTTDASLSAIGNSLIQIGPDGQEHPVAYGGRSLRTKEKNWTATEIEALELITAITEYHSFLANSNLIVYSDHISLKWLQSIKMLSGHLARWPLLLQGYKFEIRYKKGTTNVLSDALSRRVYDPPHPSTRMTIFSMTMTLLQQ